MIMKGEFILFINSTVKITIMKQVSNYVLERKIGQGVFSTVYNCRDVRTNQQYACKIVARQKMGKRAYKNLHNEIKILQNLKSNHVIRLITKLKTTNNFYLIFEYCNGGDLEQLLQYRTVLNERECKFIFRQVLEGMKEMTKINAMHRDIKTANIFIHFPNLREIKQDQFMFADLLEH